MQGDLSGMTPLALKSLGRRVEQAITQREGPRKRRRSCEVLSSLSRGTGSREVCRCLMPC
jgi:hypothetical protein